MASEGGSSAAAISAAIISSAEQRYTAPEPRRWKGYWTRYWCFKSQKREKRIVPAFQPHGASDSSRGWLPAQAVLALVPPSSPASFLNSSVHSPVAASANVCSPGPPNTTFTIGPYAHETQLVSPPVFSTFTTEPSTAAVTPPPEPHLTTPSSPDVPFAQYIASSLQAKAAARDTISPLSTSAFPSPCDTPASHTPILGHLSLRRGLRDTVSPRSTSTLASPCDTPASYTATSGPLYSGVVTRETISPRSSSTLASPCDTPASYTPKSSHYYLGSPINCLVPPSVEYSVKEDVFPAESYTTVKPISPLFHPFNPFSSPDFSHTPFATLILPCEDSASNAEDSLASVISEAPNCDDVSRMMKPEDALVPTLSEVQICESLVNSNKTGGLCVGEESHKGFWQGISTGSMLSVDCNRVDVSFSCQSDTELSTGKLKDNDIFSDGGGMSQKSVSYKVDEQRDCCFSPVNRNDTDQNTQATTESSSMQHTDV
ncbi:hypothetical protein GOP47_0013243 [Adiantum capillus-veneris]|uniref:Uncharacterized protein n=1 Tax=Adiantum capillus-veneris TaxID=13818 RepID=A0A9D4UP35_ADICA|nr:hypothetical protein GOP47_0013243 [Adiantum capillus-veneris]